MLMATPLERREPIGLRVDEWGWLVRLLVVQEFHGHLRVARCLHDQAPVIFEGVQPARDIGRMVDTDFRCQLKISAQKR